MSRLIFEGDTTRRFGEKIPRPFIEQIRAYDDGVEVDIAFYFKVSNDDEEVKDFIDSLKAGDLSQSIVLSAVTEKTLNTLKSNKDFNVLSEMLLEHGSTLGDSQFAKNRTISFSDFINGNSTSKQFAESLAVGTAAGVERYHYGVGTPSQPKTAAAYSSYNVAIKDDFYNREGTRFMKIFGTLPIDYNASDEMYVTCFVKND
jgi:hypothetical protein|tara:strand:- start:1674 stop:2279 length:606 start_codon:yes stop_codon:yes gene_type:complete